MSVIAVMFSTTTSIIGVVLYNATGARLYDDYYGCVYYGRDFCNRFGSVKTYTMRIMHDIIPNIAGWCLLTCLVIGMVPF